MITLEKKALGFDKSRTNKTQTNNTTKFVPEEDPIQENPPEDHPEDLSRQKTPCEELDFPKISTSLYNKFYFFVNEEEMREVA